MKLFFLRHGMADRSQWRGLDSERPLTEEGRAQMEMLAALFERLETGVEIVVTSPYVRARQTAEIAAHILKLSKGALVEDEHLAPGFGAPELKEVLAAHPNKNSMMLVGHEPDFSSTVARLIGGGRIAFKKAGLARIDLIDTEALVGELIWLITPKLLTRLTRAQKS